MSEQVVVRGPGEGRTLLVGGGDYVTYKTRSDETGGAYFCFEVSTTPGFGPPLHTHAYRELFYVLDGEYEFTLQRGDELETIVATAGTSISVPPNVPHTFKNATEGTVSSWISPCSSRSATAARIRWRVSSAC